MAEKGGVHRPLPYQIAEFTLSEAEGRSLATTAGKGCGRHFCPFLHTLFDPTLIVMDVINRHQHVILRSPPQADDRRI